MVGTHDPYGGVQDEKVYGELPPNWLKSTETIKEKGQDQPYKI